MKKELFIGLIAALYTSVCYATPAPLGISGIPHPSQTAITLLWEPGTGAKGYNVYRRQTPRGPAEKINSYLLPVPVFADSHKGQTFYYSARAVDQNGQESVDSLLIDSSPQTNTIFLGDDGHTLVVIPGSASQFLKSSGNKYGVPLTFALIEQTESLNGSIIRRVRLAILRGDNQKEVTDLSFPSAETSINIGYNTMNGQVAMGAPHSQPRESVLLSNTAPEQLSLYWHNGNNWIKLGGVNNRDTQTIGVKFSQAGNFELRVVPPAASLSLERANVYPGLFTPNGDGLNDRVYMILENPRQAALTGEILDLSGRQVAFLAPPVSSGPTATILTWAGQDTMGSVVPSGLYIYRIQGEDQVITGTVSVVR